MFTAIFDLDGGKANAVRSTCGVGRTSVAMTQQTCHDRNLEKRNTTHVQQCWPTLDGMENEEGKWQDQYGLDKKRHSVKSRSMWWQINKVRRIIRSQDAMSSWFEEITKTRCNGLTRKTFLRGVRTRQKNSSSLNFFLLSKDWRMTGRRRRHVWSGKSPN